MPSTAYAFADLLTLTRNGKASVWDAAGNFAELANNVPRLTYDPLTLAPLGLSIHPGRTNLLPNPRAEGAVASGAMPTGWSLPSAISGLTFQNLGPVSANGMTGLRVRASGTATADGSASLLLGNSMSAAQLTAYASSVFCRLVAGSPATLRNFDLRTRGLNASNVQIWGPPLVNMKGVDSVIRRFVTASVSPADASAAAADTLTQAQIMVQFNWLSGAVIDLTFDVFFPQFEASGGASPPILPNAGATGQSTVLGESILASALLMTGLNNTGFTAIATFRLDYLTVAASNFHEIFQLNDASSGSGDAVRLHVTSAGTVALRTLIGGTTFSISTPALSQPLIEHTVAVSVEPGVSRISLDGAAALSVATTGIPSNVNRMLVGNGGNSGSFLDGTLKRLDLLPRPVTAAELAALSLPNA